MKLVKPKPDTSLAKKTGHFNLLTTVWRPLLRQGETEERPGIAH